MSRGNCSDAGIFDSAEDMPVKWPLIGIFMCTVSVLGALMNTMLVYTFLKNREFRNSYMLYLCAIAAGDTFRCISYLMIFGGEVYYNQFPRHLYFLYIMWNYYTPHIFAISRTAAMCVTYLLIAASTERYLAVKIQNYRSTVRTRSIAICVILATTVLYCMPMYFEIIAVTVPNCTYGQYGYVRLNLTPLKFSWGYATLYETYFNNVLQVFLPFLMLLTLNFAIIVRLKSMIRLGNALFSRFAMGADAVNRQQRNLRLATVTLVALITGYLLANLPSVVLTFLERIFENKIKRSPGYALAVDCTSIMHIMYAAFRFMVYVCCNDKIRRDFCRHFYCAGGHSQQRLEQSLSRDSIKMAIMPQRKEPKPGKVQENGISINITEPPDSENLLEVL